MNDETPWNSGRLASRGRPHRLLFGQMYEDSEVDLEAFRGRQRIFSIASAGDTAMHLSHEHEVVACDINPAQLAYARRRAQGGVIEIGDAERLMRAMRRLMPLAGWHKGTLRDFLAMTDTAEQLVFWRTRLNTLRFRVGFDALMSRAALRAAYTPRLIASLPPHFGHVLRQRLERGFALHPNATNPYIRALFGEEVPANQPAASPIQAALPIQFIPGDAAAVLESGAPSSFDAFTLSNILDGATAAYRDRLVGAVRRAATPDAVVILRSFAEPTPQTQLNHAAHDRSMLWGILDIQSARDFC